jgi:uncharacterized protein YecT (DUF1311 family)
MAMRIRVVLILVLLTIVRAASAQDSRRPSAKLQQETCDGGTYDMVRCLTALADTWDTRLDKAYQEALKDAQPKQSEKLRAAQRLWVQYRDANCDYYAFGEGTVARVEAAECRRAMTASRARELAGDPK